MASAARKVRTATEQKPGSTLTVLPGDAGDGLVRRTVLPNGLRILTEAMPTVRSVAFGIWVGVGSRDETPTAAGASHYLEHLLFKGTGRRDALAISSALDAVGGEMNAFTGKEYTCFYARTLDTDLPIAVDVVCDMVTSSRIRTPDVDSERDVILEEISMRDDDPTDLVHDEFCSALFGDSDLGRPVLGTVETIGAITRNRINRWYTSRYTPDQMVVAAAGNIDHATVVRLVKKAFALAEGPGRSDSELVLPPAAARVHPTTHRRKAHPSGVRLTHRVTEQANVVLGVPGLGRSDDRRWAFGVLNAALGGGMSSRLFQEIREKRGLAYSTYSFHQQFADTGVFGLYAGCQPGKVDQVLSIAREQLLLAAEHGLTDEEILRGKGQLRGSVVLGMEDTGSRMTRIGKGELVTGEVIPVAGVLADIEAVTAEQVREIAREVLTQRTSLAVIGPFEDPDRFASAVA